MKMKKLLSALLCLCLVGGVVPALAAPARDVQTMDVLLDDNLMTLLNIIDTAIPEECFSEPGVTLLEDGEQPATILVEQALAAGVLYARPTTVLTKEEADELYHQLFTYGELNLEEANSLIFVSLTADGVETYPEIFVENGGAGVWVYSAAFDGTDVTLECDLFYLEYADFGGYQTVYVDELPEDAVTWVCNAEMSLRADPEKEFGYTLNSLTISPVYQDGNLSRWQDVENTEYEYSVSIPSILGLCDDDPAHRSWQTGDGSVTLTIDAEEESLSYAEALSRFTQAHPELTVIEEEEFGNFYAFGEGCFILLCVGEDINWNYTVTLTFPAERQAEYSLYAEIIRNSMIVWGLSNG